jgi:hypothetical protein
MVAMVILVSVWSLQITLVFMHSPAFIKNEQEQDEEYEIFKFFHQLVAIAK